MLTKCYFFFFFFFQVLEYAVSLNSEDHYIPVLQVCDNSDVVWKEYMYLGLLDYIRDLKI